jgi:preprotein translocase subunit SecG
MIRRFAWLAVALFGATLCLGCGNSDRDKGKNSDKDQPRPAGLAG